jgi:hypothetical protein
LVIPSKKIINMKKVVLIGICILISILSCRKDHPDDIPKWLNEKIKLHKRTYNCGQYADESYNINEYVKKDDGQIIYTIDIYIDPCQSLIYNSEGIILCGTGTPSCDSLFNKLSFIRHIWDDVQNCDH